MSKGRRLKKIEINLLKKKYILSMILIVEKLRILTLSLVLFVFSLCYILATDCPALPQYSYLTPQKTHQLDVAGQPLVTTTSVICSIDMLNAQKALLIDSYYNHWVIPGLNALNTKLHDPMSIFDRIETSDNGEELFLYFDLQYPFRINDIMIPFIFTVCSHNEAETRVALRLKERNIAVKNAALNLLVQNGATGTILSAELTVDFSYIIDILLNKPLYSENTENRLRLCMEQFLLLITAQNPISSL